MRLSVHKKFAAGAAALLLLGGAGGAVAATQLSGGSGAQAYINDVAAHLNVSPSALTTAMRAAATDQIDAAVTAGRITQAQADALEQRIDQGDGLPFLGHPFGRTGFGRGLRGGLAAAAQYLGTAEATVRSDLHSGRSLADLASSTSGKSVAGLEGAILAAERNRLLTAVSSGRITSRQEQVRLADLSSRIDSLVTRTWNGMGARSPHADGWLRQRH